jgi:cytochrome c peroxidase
MLDEDSFVRKHKQESVELAKPVYDAIVNSLRKHEPGTSQTLARYFKKPVEELVYTDYARAVASFIRSQFRIRETKLERWPVPGSEDTELGVFMGPEVRHGEAAVYARVQA